MPRSAARWITLASEVVMQPKERDVTFSPVFPSVRQVSFTSFAGACGAPIPAAGSASPAARKLRREDGSMGFAPLRRDTDYGDEYNIPRAYPMLGATMLGATMPGNRE